LAIRVRPKTGHNKRPIFVQYTQAFAKKPGQDIYTYKNLELLYILPFIPLLFLLGVFAARAVFEEASVDQNFAVYIKKLIYIYICPWKLTI